MTEQTIKHEPLSEDDASGLLPKGDYPGIIRLIEIKSGKKDPNKKYFVATVDVWDETGRPVSLVTWLALPALLKHMYDAAGQSDKYQNSTLSTKDCEGAKVICRIKISKPTEDYPTPQNRIWDFVKPKASGQMTSEQLIDALTKFDDPIPSFA